MKRSKGESNAGSFYSEEDLSYIAQLFNQLIVKKVVSSTTNSSAYDPPSNQMDSNYQVTAAVPETEINQELTAEYTDPAPQNAEVVDKTSSDTLTDSEEMEISGAFDKLTAILQSESPEELKRLLEDLTMINMMDVGGQPAFLEMLPTLTISPALYLLFFRLDQELNKHYPVRFHAADSENEIMLESSYCIEEVLHQCLASIACFSYHPSQEHTESTSEPQASSHAVLFGTYKDKVTEVEITEKESAFRQQLTRTNHYKEGLVLKTMKGKMFFEVDNMFGTDESEMADIRTNIEKVIKDLFPAIPIPVSWLMFRIMLHFLHKPVVSLAQCKVIASRLSMSTPVQEAIWFFHHNVGSLMHYPEISSIQDIIICDPQVIFDCISKLIIDKFQYANYKLLHHYVDEFHQKGQFNLSHIEDKTGHQQYYDLKLNQLVDLLKHLNIVAEVKGDQEESSPSQSERKFIMPAILKYASEDDLKVLISDSYEQQAPPLIIRFEGGFIPFGIFCAIIAHLIAHQTSLSPKWQLCDDQMRRNKVTFCVDGALYTTLVSQPQCIKIFASRHPCARKKKSLPYLCSCVRQTVIEALETVMSKMKYKPFGSTIAPSRQLFDLAFTCCIDNTHVNHVMTVFEDGQGELCAKCLEGGLLLDLGSEHLIWFKVRKA